MFRSLPRFASRIRATMAGSSRVHVAVVALFIGCAVGVGAASLFSTSPGEGRATRTIPELPVPTAVLTRQVLKEEVRAPCSAESRVTRVLPPHLPPRIPRVVTAVGARTGHYVATGDLLATVSGIPLFAFVTDLPFYRNLSVGNRGPDVAALERSLVAAGALSVGDGFFDGRTAGALNALYGSALRDSPQLTGRLLLTSAVSIPPRSVVSEVDVALGQVVQATTSLMLLAADARRLACDIPGEVAMTVGESLPIGGSARRATVRSVGSLDAATGQRRIVVETTGPATGASDLIIPIHATRKGVLTVPAGAIWTRARGGFEVRKLLHGQVLSVPIEVGATAGGYAEISGNGLTDGDRVQLSGASEGAAVGQPPSTGTTP
jgi:hypothetical protein